MTRKERLFRPFTQEELKVISESNSKITLTDLAVKLDINYSTLSSMIKQHRVFFNPLRTPRVMPIKESAALNKVVDSKGNELVTDELMKSWFSY